MVSFKDSRLEKLVIHSIKSSGEDKVINLSEDTVELGRDLIGILKNFFLNKFKMENQLHHFTHEHDLMMNEMFSFSEMIFKEKMNFVEVSQAMANFLFSKSRSSNIKEGEVYIVSLSGIRLGDEIVDGIGVFKSENKDTFLKIFPEGNKFNLEKQEGVNIKKLDKGAIILNTETSDGYRVLAIDQTNKTEQAKYWFDHFLKLTPVKDNFYQTDQFLDVFKQINKRNLEELDGVQKVDMVKSTVEFMEANETFDNQQFYDEVLQDDSRKRLFEKVYEEQNGVLPDKKERFEISKPALKKSKRFIRSVIKLDNSFHVYVHTNRERIEKGFDESKQLQYYKLYFHDES